MWSLALSLFVLLIVVALRNRGNWPDGPGLLAALPNKGVHLHQQLRSLAMKYGDFFTFNFGQAKVIVLTSPTAINDLIVKKGSKYSSRPSSSPTASIVGQNRLAQLQYGDEFRRHRKVIHGLLGMQNARIFMPYQEFEVRQSMKLLLDNPGAFYHEVHRFSASVTFSLLLGARFANSKTQIPQAIQHFMYLMFTNIKPGYWIADWIPLLNYLPDLFAPWRGQARKVFASILEFWSIFYDRMATRVENGTAPECFLKLLLESKEVQEFTEVDRRIILSELLPAGAETTATTLQWFFKAAVSNPDKVKEAQRELDQVVGRDRLPAWEDRKNLPYINAFIQEVHRWGSPAVLAFYRATSEADTYRGKDIPAKTTVIYNTYGVHHNDSFYEDHERFMPERFLPGTDARQQTQYAYAPTHFNFGAGRRECPGKHVADSSLYISISRFLWAFDFKGPMPGDGLVGTVPIVAPAKFECDVAPRDEAIRQRILQAAEHRDASLQAEDAGQYEADVVEVMAKQKVDH